MKPLADAIWSEWDGDAPLKAAMPALFFTEAPPEQAMPYGVFWRVDGMPDRTFTSTSDETTIQFDVYVNEWDATTVFAIEPLLVAVYDEAALTVAGHTFIVMLHELTEGPVREDECWHLIVQFGVRVKQ